MRISSVSSSAAVSTDKGISGKAVIMANHYTTDPNEYLVQHENGQNYVLRLGNGAQRDDVRRLREAVANSGRVEAEVQRFGRVMYRNSILGEVRSWNGRTFDPAIREINGEMRRAHFDGLRLVTESEQGGFRLSPFGTTFRTTLLESAADPDAFAKNVKYLVDTFPTQFKIDDDEILGLTPDAIFYIEDVRNALGVDDTTKAEETATPDETPAYSVDVTG